jgi:hypothetical protein
MRANMKRILAGLLLTGLSFSSSMGKELGEVVLVATNPSTGEQHALSDQFPNEKGDTGTNGVNGVYKVENLDDIIEHLIRNNWEAAKFHLWIRFPGESGTNGEPDGHVKECAVYDARRDVASYETVLDRSQIDKLKQMVATISVGHAQGGKPYESECRIYLGIQPEVMPTQKISLKKLPHGHHMHHAHHVKKHMEETKKSKDAKKDEAKPAADAAKKDEPKKDEKKA